MKKHLLILVFIIALFSMLAACNDKDDDPVMSSDPAASLSPSMSSSMAPSIAPSMTPEATVAP
ncbi:hypothetical protein EHS13_26035 [Paenibacillus psychroresistens]|uniref:Uncharacterized protein n=1 Tax=Paenibacillus psychroresistens TaxID=1778678 RepID=A0A6B8RP29_9BACL|nr:hypothetical protein [Paenibacillus psychroresistens]QGQ98100.1 hypothetical protein EHS13_26035 [Paenibacillus psychroresistens]